MSVAIPLCNGGHALVSEEDAGAVEGRRWYKTARRSSLGGYYVRTYIARQTVYLHSLIMGQRDGLVIDHVNRDGLDNRRENLRHATRSLNQVNRMLRPPASGYRGVYWHVQGQKWSATVTCQGKVYRSRRRASAVEAAHDYDAMARKHFGDFAVLNFPVCL